MKVSADSFAARVAAAARPVRPWLHIGTSRRVARFLVAAGARPGPELLRIEDLEVAEHRRSAHVDQTIDYLAADYLAELNQRRLDLRGKDLSGKDLSGADLYGRDLRGVVMRLSQRRKGRDVIDLSLGVRLRLRKRIRDRRSLLCRPRARQERNAQKEGANDNFNATHHAVLMHARAPRKQG